MENKVITKEELIKRILEQRERLSFFGVTSIGLFGLFVRGEQTDSSDIDILVEFTPERHTFDNFMEVSFLITAAPLHFAAVTRQVMPTVMRHM